MAQFPLHSSMTVAQCPECSGSPWGSLGRGFDTAEHEPSQQCSIVISHSGTIHTACVCFSYCMNMDRCIICLFNNLSGLFVMTLHSIHSKPSKPCHTDYIQSTHATLETMLLCLCVLPRLFVCVIPQCATNRSHGSLMFPFLFFFLFNLCFCRIFYFWTIV